MNETNDHDPNLHRLFSQRTIPEHRRGFWDELNRSLGAHAARPRRRHALVAAAALVLLAGLGAVLFVAGNDDPEEVTVAGPVETDDPASPTSEPGTAETPADTTASTLPAGDNSNDDDDSNTPSDIADAPEPLEPGQDLGPGRLAGISSDATVVWLTDPDSDSDVLGCEGVAVDRLWAVADERRAATEDPLVTGDVQFADGLALVVGQCEEQLTGIWWGDKDALGRLDVTELTVPSVEGYDRPRPRTVRLAGDGRVTALLPRLDDPGIGLLVAVEPTSGQLTTLSNQPVRDGALRADGALVLLDDEGLSIDEQRFPGSFDTLAVDGETVAAAGTDELMIITGTDETRTALPAVGVGGPLRLSDDGSLVLVPAVEAEERVMLAVDTAGQVTRVSGALDARARSGGLVVTETADGRVVTGSLSELTNQAPPESTTTEAAPVPDQSEPWSGPQPAAGDLVTFTGRADDTYSLRSAPSSAAEVAAEARPDWAFIATGEAVLDGDVVWVGLVGEASTLWAPLSEVAVPGTSRDAGLGPLPLAELDELPGLLARELGYPREPVPVAIDENQISIILDVSFEDDAVKGERLTVTLTALEDQFIVEQVEIIPLCARGVSDGLCL